MKLKRFKKPNIKNLLSKLLCPETPEPENKEGMVEKLRVHKITFSLVPEIFPYIYVEHYFEEAPKKDEINNKEIEK